MLTPARGAAALRGPDRDLFETIASETGRLCVEEYGDDLRAVVMTGSLARDEATTVEREGRRLTLGDAEFLMIFRDRAAPPSAARTAPLERKIEAGLERHGIVCRVSLGAVGSVYLRALRPHIFAYELRTCGKVIRGEPAILSLIRPFSPSDIPREDAWRLLANRVIELLEVIADPTARVDALPPEAHYRTVKLYLDMATSLLVFAGGYAPTYRERAGKLQTLAHAAPPDGAWPFSLGDFADHVGACTRWKLGAERAPGEAGSDFLPRALGYARQLWRWELARLTGAEDLSHRALFDRWMRMEPLHQRLRGWLYVVRSRGWHRSCRQWPRWARHAWRASPRYWIYGATGELLFGVLARDDREQQGTAPDWSRWRRALPEASRGRVDPAAADWRRLADDIGWNYREFLVGTRA
jgi:hypothetical protein